MDVASWCCYSKRPLTNSCMQKIPFANSPSTTELGYEYMYFKIKIASNWRWCGCISWKMDVALKIYNRFLQAAITFIDTELEFHRQGDATLSFFSKQLSASTRCERVFILNSTSQVNERQHPIHADLIPIFNKRQLPSLTGCNFKVQWHANFIFNGMHLSSTIECNFNF